MLTTPEAGPEGFRSESRKGITPSHLTMGPLAGERTDVCRSSRPVWGASSRQPWDPDGGGTGGGREPGAGRPQRSLCHSLDRDSCAPSPGDAPRRKRRRASTGDREVDLGLVSGTRDTQGDELLCL